MNKFFSGFFFLILVWPSFSIDVYVTPYLKGCGSKCAGHLQDPFDNLLLAINATLSLSPVTIILLYDSLTPHYTFLKELNSNSSYIYQFADSFRFKVASDLTIRPLYCDEQQVTTNTSLTDKCIQKGQKLTVFLKSTGFTINVLTKVRVEGIIFDAVEDTKLLNLDSSDLQDCIYRRKRCCQEGSDNSTMYPSTVKCAIRGNFTNPYEPSSSLFMLNSTINNFTSLIFQDTNFRNFISPHLLSLVQTGSQSFNLTLNGSNIENVFFSAGTIFHSANSTVKNGSSIIFQNVNFTNYNIWDILLPYSGRNEGYLFFAKSIFSGVILVSQSYFQNIISALRRECWTLEELDQNWKYYYPLNNQVPRSSRDTGRWSNIYSLYDNDHNASNGSSLIFIRAMDGALKIIDCTFQDIIGTSGSVLRVDDVIAANSSFAIYNSTFNNNFAYDGFANIRIAKKTRPYFTALYDCPRVEMVNSTVTNTAGCPGAYGNVLFLCYWFPTVKTPDYFADLGSDQQKIAQFRTNLSKLKDPNFPALVTVKDSIFQNNLIAVSNSLAILGAHSTLLEGNRFQDNGGTTGKLGIYIFNNMSSHSRRFPKVQNATKKGTEMNFGQATAVYLYGIINLYSKRNIYKGNWGPWEGSQVLAASLSIRDWIQYGIIKHEGDIFRDHSGPPSSFLSFLQVDGWSYFTEPITCTQYANLTNTKMFGDGINIPAQISMQNVSVINNTAEYDFNSFTYNSKYTSALIGYLVTGWRHRSGFFKLIGYKEAIELAPTLDAYNNPLGYETQFVFSGGEITGNKLLSSGCLFTTAWINSYIVENSKIRQNKVNDANPWPGDSQKTKRLVFTNIDQMTDALFCLRMDDILNNSTGGMIWNNLLMENNRGTLMGASQGGASRFYSYNSIFSNNTCKQTGMFLILDMSSFISLNNLFVENNNTLGVTFLNNPNMLAAAFNVYLRNDGMYSSITFLKESLSSLNFEESLAKVYWNSVNPPYKFFYNDIVPQGGLYFITSGSIILSQSEFWQNTPYSGLVTSIESQIYFENCSIADHHTKGISIFGTYVQSSILNIFKTKVDRFSITGIYSEKFISSAAIVLLTSKLFINDLEVSNGLISKKASLIFGNAVTASIDNMKVINCYQDYFNQPALLVFIFSDVLIRYLESSNTTGLLSSSWSKVKFESGSIQDLRALNNIQYLFSGDNTNLEFTEISYTGNGEYGELSPFVKGENNHIEILKCNFLDASNGYNTIFDLKDGGTLFVSDSTFKYTSKYINTTMFDLTSVNNVTVRQSLFGFTGRIVRASNIYGEFYFVSNTILTNSHIRSILLTNTQSCYILDNYFFGITHISADSDASISEEDIVLSESQLQFVDNSGNIIFKGNIFASLLGLYGIVQINAKTFTYNVDFTDNSFISNTASQGGAIYLDAIKISATEMTPTAKITSSIFVLNRAIDHDQSLGIGGALYTTTQDLTEQSTQITDSFFLRNSAKFDGGAIFFDYSPIEVSKTSIFRANKALQANHIASNPSYFVYVDGTVDLNFTYIPSTDETPNNIADLNKLYAWYNLPSGLETNQTFKFALLDMFGQLVNDDSSILTFKAQDSDKDFSSPNQIILQAQGGYYYMVNPKFQYRVSSTLNVTFASTAQNNFKDFIPAVIIEMSFRSCGRGEFVSEHGNYITCEKCPTGFWQLEANTTAVSCTDCETEKMICLGGDRVGPKPGYWRMNETAELVLPCPRTSSCLGNQITNQEISQIESISLSPMGECEIGYQGNLCSNCASGWAKNSNSQSAECLPCVMSVGSIFLLGFLVCLKIGLIVFSVKGSMQLAEYYAQKKGSNGQITNDAILIRILLNYLQLVSFISKIPITWPNVLKEVFSTTSKVSSVSEQAFSLECLIFSMADALGFKPAFFKVLFTAITPFFFIFLGILFWIIYFKFTKKSILYNKDFLNKVITTIVVICYQNQAAALQSGLSLFRCTNLYRMVKPLYFLEADYDLECWTNSHVFWMLALGIPVLFVWMIAFPGILFFILTKNKKKLHIQKVAKKYSFIYGGYRQEKYYWEFVILLRKIVLTVTVIVAGLHSISLQLYVCILTIISSYILHEYHKPYSDTILNDLERASLFSSGIVNFAGLYFYMLVQEPALDWIIIVFGLLGELYFFVQFLRLFLKVKITKFLQNSFVKKLLARISHRFKALTPVFLLNRFEGNNDPDTKYPTSQPPAAKQPTQVVDDPKSPQNEMMSPHYSLVSLDALKFENPQDEPRENAQIKLDFPKEILTSLKKTLSLTKKISKRDENDTRKYEKQKSNNIQEDESDKDQGLLE